VHRSGEVILAIRRHDVRAYSLANGKLLGRALNRTLGAWPFSARQGPVLVSDLGRPTGKIRADGLPEDAWFW